MFKQKISIRINSKHDRNKLFEEFEILIAALIKTGQVAGNYETPFIATKEIISFPTTLERGSLSKKYFDKHVIKRIKNHFNIDY